ncbi:MAG: carbohydrate porin [Betaproteobacteria bacterium]|nr:MAG: carbohydrate porin [Betaproteobacteria bacterium]
MIRLSRTVAVIAAPLLLALLARPAFAQSSGDRNRTLGGPEGVSPQIEQTLEDRDSAFQPDTLKRRMQSYYDWKQQLKDEHGFGIGFNAYWLYQNASDVLGSEDDAWGQIYRLQGNWELFGRGTGHPGRIEWRIEHRSNIGSNLSPSELGGRVGTAALNSGFAYSPSFDTDLAVFNWTQLFNNQTAGVAVGRLAFDVYLDAMAFQTFSRGFINRAFVLNPTIATTGIGALGAVAKGFVGNQFWIGGQIYDGNAASGDFDMDTFDEGEWLKAVEFGWTPAIDRRKTDRIQFTYWDKDAREKAGVPKGSGWAVSTSWKVSDKAFPFLRFGHSDGGAGVAAKDAASIGLEYTTRPDQALSVGFGWAKPVSPASGPTLRDEYVLEASYKFQLLRGLSLLPDLQYIKDPAKNPTTNSVWVVGLRAILTL